MRYDHEEDNETTSNAEEAQFQNEGVRMYSVISKIEYYYSQDEGFEGKRREGDRFGRIN